MSREAPLDMTQRMYYTDSYAQDFSSTVVESLVWEGRPAVVLAETLFYPESGGQPFDTGLLGERRVEEVVEQGGRILHVLDRGGLEQGQPVGGRIDWPRRFDHMQQHTGQHILSQAFLETLEASTESFHLGSSSSTIDLSVEALSKEEIYAAEDLANRVIFENRKVQVHFLDAAEQEKMPVRKASSREGEIRIIEINRFDYSPCGGTHCRCTGEVGLIKIRRWERVKKKARVEFFCGWRALADYRWKNRAIYQLSKTFSVADTEVPEAVARLIDSEKDSRREALGLRAELLDLEAERIAGRADSSGGLSLIKALLQDRSPKEMNALASKILSLKERAVVLLGSQGERPFLLLARSPECPELDLRELLDTVAPCISGKGGGSPDRVQSGGTRSEGVAEALDRAEAGIRERSRKKAE